MGSGAMPRTWFRVVHIMCFLAIITNVLFTFTCSDQMYNLVGNLYRTKGKGDDLVHRVSKKGMWVLFGVEHALFAFAFTIRHVMPGRLMWVKDAIRARQYRRRQALLREQHS